MRDFLDRFGTMLAFLLIVLVASFGFMRIEQVRDERAADLARQTEQRQTEREELTNELCQEIATTREALRLQIIATADLAQSLVPAQSPELVDEVIKFQEKQLATLPPSKCEQHGGE